MGAVAVGATSAGALEAAPAVVAPIAPGNGRGTAPEVAQPEDSPSAAIIINREACPDRAARVEGRIRVHYRRKRARSTVLPVT
jgi:hypothetical protein